MEDYNNRQDRPITCTQFVSALVFTVIFFFIAKFFYNMILIDFLERADVSFVTKLFTLLLN